jgi:hypothetical protein
VSQTTALAEPLDPEPLWDLERTAEYLNFEIEYVRKLAAKDRDFPGIRIGKYWRFIPSQVVAWVESR